MRLARGHSWRHVQTQLPHAARARCGFCEASCRVASIDEGGLCVLWQIDGVLPFAIALLSASVPFESVALQAGDVACGAQDGTISFASCLPPATAAPPVQNDEQSAVLGRRALAQPTRRD